MKRILALRPHATATLGAVGSIISLLLAAPIGASPPPGLEKGGNPDLYAERQVLVKFVDGLSAAQVDVALAANELQKESPLQERRGEVAFVRARVSPGSEVEDVVAALRRDPQVRWAEPNGFYQGSVPNDPWCVDDPSPETNTIYDQWGYYRIGAGPHWDNQPGGGSLSLVRVAVLDSGLDFDHPDASVQLCAGGGCLAPNWLEEFGTPGVDDDGNGWIDDMFGIDFVRSSQNTNDIVGYDGNANVWAADPDNSCGDGVGSDGGVYHGTHVTGILGTWTNNANAFAGITWFAEILPVRVLNPENWGSWADIAEGIEYAADTNADVINLSLGGYGYSAAVHSAIQHAHAQNCVIVCAAGNAGADSVHYPARFAETIAVGASDPNDQRASFSNWGPEIDLVAPGVRIFSNAVTSAAAASPQFPVGSPDYYWANGTSMATPMVSAIAANMISVYGPGNVTNEGIRNGLKAVATPLPGTWSGAGLLDASEILESVDAPVVAVASRSSLHQNTPNPFRPSTRIAFTLERPADVRLDVFNLAGRRVQTLADGLHATGTHEVTWTGRDAAGRPATAGVYLYRLAERDPVSGVELVQTRKLTLLR